MSSGTFGGTDFAKLSKDVLTLPVKKVTRVAKVKKKSWRGIFKKKG